MKRSYRVLLLLVMSIGIPTCAVFGLPETKVSGNHPAAHGQSLTDATSNGPPIAMQERAEIPAVASAELQQQLMRLRQAGATYYRLEAMGDEGPYQFICKVPNPGQPNEFRVLRATGKQLEEPIRVVLSALKLP